MNFVRRIEKVPPCWFAESAAGWSLDIDQAWLPLANAIVRFVVAVGGP